MRWLVLVVMLGGFVVALGASRRPGEAFADPVFSGVAIVVDVQVTLGIILWLFDSGWDQGFFIAVIHPVTMLLALAATHMAIARGRKTAKTDHAGGNRIVAVGIVIALILIVGGIPWERL